MTEESPKPETPPNPAPKEQEKDAAKTEKTAEKPGFFDKLKTAWDKATEDKDRHFIEKVGIFFSTFFSDMKELNEDEKKAVAEAEASVKKSLDETSKDAQKAVELADTVEKSDKEFYQEVLDMGVASLKSLDADRQKSAHLGLKKLDTAVKTGKASEKEIFEIDEAFSLAGVGFMTFQKLKQKFPNKDDFKKALDRLSTVSDSSQYPLKKLLSRSVLGIFKVDIGLTDVDDVYKFVSDFGIPVTEILSVKDTLSGIGAKEMDDLQRQKIIDTMGKFFFPSTDIANVGYVVDLIRQLKLNGTAEIDTQTLTDLIFHIDDKDHSRLVAVLTGVKGSDEEKQLAEAA
ncbi:hypothetical protein A3B60_03110 [Candidatus Peregrinibacteria bacterium RIFCSPLOWO2_01_FULL_39_12]|nr:MAG: hypothetical protein A3B60_03110 [Candidatus Peregrinibacteria bacterium RIFCSPLOWO2_01_FULL_39_12]